MSTWMVVEDEPDIYEILLTLFGIWGIEGRAFVDGEEAVAWLDEVDNGTFQGELPELAMLDIRLPGDINGPEVGERIRKSPKLKNITIVLITAYPLRQDEYNAIMAQTEADRLIEKPLPKPAELQKMLEELLAQRRIRLALQAEEQSVVSSTATLPADDVLTPPAPMKREQAPPFPVKPSVTAEELAEFDDSDETQRADPVGDRRVPLDFDDDRTDRTPPPDNRSPRKPGA
ncbi:MAG TPA: response regulator [Aggregatilineales bacterium]|nr:response regulator [Aggregatilineales bacterium]